MLHPPFHTLSRWRPLACLALILSGAMAGPPVDGAEEVTARTRAKQLEHLVRQDCGSCHGMTLNGGLGPPLLPAALVGKPAEYLKRVILDGRAGSAMPGWSPILTEADADWIAARLLRGLPDAR